MLIRVSVSLLLCGWLGSCALPLDFEDEGWDRGEAFADEGIRPPPRVVFEPPRFVTLPPELMPPQVHPRMEDGLEPIPVDPPVEPVLPAFAQEPLPNVTPLWTDAATAEPPASNAPVLAQRGSIAMPGPSDKADPPAADDNQADKPPRMETPPELSKSGQAPGFKMKSTEVGGKWEEVAQHLTTGMLPVFDQPGVGTQERPEAMPSAEQVLQDSGTEAAEAESKSAGPDTAAAVAASVEEPPYGIADPLRPHLVRSPRAKPLQLVDVTGMAPGDHVKCPFTGDLFRVPAMTAGMKTASPATAQ